MLIGTKRTATLLAILVAALAGWAAGRLLASGGVHGVRYPALAPSAAIAVAAALGLAAARTLGVPRGERARRGLALVAFALAWLAVVFAGYVSVPLGYRAREPAPQAVLPVMLAAGAALFVGTAALGRDVPLRHGIWVAALALAVAAAVVFLVLVGIGAVL